MALAGRPSKRLGQIVAVAESSMDGPRARIEARASARRCSGEASAFPPRSRPVRHGPQPKDVT
jgi:hypothetical protein